MLSFFFIIHGLICFLEGDLPGCLRKTREFILSLLPFLISSEEFSALTGQQLHEMLIVDFYIDALLIQKFVGILLLLSLVFTELAFNEGLTDLRESDDGNQIHYHNSTLCLFNHRLLQFLLLFSQFLQSETIVNFYRLEHLQRFLQVVFRIFILGIQLAIHDLQVFVFALQRFNCQFIELVLGLSYIILRFRRVETWMIDLW